MLYVVGATLETLFVFPVLRYLSGNGPQLSSLQFPFLLICAFCFGVFYCVFASFAFKPKRIFSPIALETLVWSYVVLATFLLWFLKRLNASTTTHIHLIPLILAGAGRILLAAIFVGMLGLTQFLAITVLVGLNGMESDVTRMGWKVSANYDTVMKSLREDASLRRILRLEPPRKREGFDILQSTSSELTQVIVMVAPHSKSQTNVVFLCYDKLQESIVKSPVATELSDILHKHLKKLGHTVSLRTNATLMVLGLKTALRPTTPRLIAWSGTVARWKGLTIGLFVLLGFVFLLWKWFGIGSEDFVLTIAGFAALQIVWVLAPVISERTQT